MKKIEILAPAGTIEKGYSAIASGCDAIYGGLEIGNARQRARNFSLIEYKKMLDHCREKKVKFYLTLNILMRTEEIDDIIELLKQIDLPDALIVADLGLMLSIKENFPDLPIHASTQFGASTLEDVRFLESIGASRAILSRELTVDEIKHIKDNTNIELEVFVYGTQCTMFSGQCLWGGLITECSGNRGKCNGMCRDFYRSGGSVGQLMYQRDLEIGNHIKILEQIGVTSAKIEGRLRSESEIKAVISAIRSDTFSEGYSSYLSNQLPVKGMFHAVNPRIRYSAASSDKYTGNDLLICNNEYIHGNDICDYSDCKYIKTVYSKPLINGANIALKLKYQNRTLKTVSFINTSGERELIPIKNATVNKISVNELCKHILDLIKYNVYELISEVPDAETVKVDIEEINAICNDINIKCNKKNKEVAAENNITIDRSTFIIQTNKAADIVDFSNCGYKNFIFEIESEKEFEKALSLTQDITFKLPVLDFSGKLNSLMKKLVDRKIMLTRSTQMVFLEKYKYKYISADYTINCWNEQSLKFLKNAGISAVAVHPELELNYSVESIKKCDLDPQIIIAGKIPIGFTRACFGELNICDHRCNNSIKMKNTDKNYELDIDCSGALGFRTVYRNGIDIAFSSHGKFKKRIIISKFSEELKNQFIKNDHIEIKNPNYLYRRNVK